MKRRRRRRKEGKGIGGGAKGWSKREKDGGEKEGGVPEEDEGRKVRASAHLHKQSSGAPGARGPCKVAHQIWKRIKVVCSLWYLLIFSLSFTISLLNHFTVSAHHHFSQR